MASAIRRMLAMDVSRLSPEKSMNPVKPHMCSNRRRAAIATQLLDDPGRIASDNTMRRYRMNDYSTCREDAPFANVGENDGPFAHPYIRPDRDLVEPGCAAEMAGVVQMLTLATRNAHATCQPHSRMQRGVTQHA